MKASEVAVGYSEDRGDVIEVIDEAFADVQWSKRGDLRVRAAS